MAMQTCSTLHAATAAVKNEIQDFLQSGNYYVTEEIAKEMSLINNSLEHLSLDGTFLMSKNWQKKPGNFHPEQTAHHLSGALNGIYQLCCCLQELKKNLLANNVNGKQENQLREMHQWAITSLHNSQKNLEPYTFDAADRIKQFGDTIGVTDRYTAYRQNLTRGTRDPFRLQTPWMDKTGELGLMNKLVRSHTSLGSSALDQRVDARTMRYVGEPSCDFSQFGSVPLANMGAMKKQIRYGLRNPPMTVTKGYRTIDSLYPKSSAPLDGGAPYQSGIMNEVRALNTLNACEQYEKADRYSNVKPPSLRPFEKMTVQEQFGIKTAFPAKSEYMTSFKAPDTNIPTSDFIINPSPNFAINGRHVQISCYEVGSTEYKDRYVWPDGEKLIKLPWLKN